MLRKFKKDKQKTDEKKLKEIEEEDEGDEESDEESDEGEEGEEEPIKESDKITEEQKYVQVPVFLNQADKDKMIYETHLMVSQILKSFQTKK